MSLLGKIARATGLYGQLREHFITEVLMPFVTQSQVNLAEAAYLAELTREARGVQPIVEIGTLFGASTKVILLNKAPNQRLMAIDLFSWNPANLTPDQHYAVTSFGLRAFAGTDGFDIIRIDKNEFYKTYKGPAPALVFLDAVHSYEETRKDITWAKAAGAKIICGHDYATAFPGVVKAVDEAGGPSELRGTLWRLI